MLARHQARASKGQSPRILLVPLDRQESVERPLSTPRGRREQKGFGEGCGTSSSGAGGLGGVQNDDPSASRNAVGDASKEGEAASITPSWSGWRPPADGAFGERGLGQRPDERQPERFPTEIARAD